MKKREGERNRRRKKETERGRKKKRKRKGEINRRREKETEGGRKKKKEVEKASKTSQEERERETYSDIANRYVTIDRAL